MTGTKTAAPGNLSAAEPNLYRVALIAVGMIKAMIASGTLPEGRLFTFPDQFLAATGDEWKTPRALIAEADALFSRLNSSV